MEFGLTLPQGSHADLRQDVTRVARQAEQAGFASLWAYERVLFPLTPSDGMYGVDGLPWMDYYRYCADPLTVLTVAGAVTERVRLGTSILLGPLYRALPLARTLATMDQVTGGRVVAGLGSGWSTDEYRAVGADFAGRGTGFDELIDGLRAMFGPDPVTYRDSQISIDNALVSPKPVGQLPILLAGVASSRAFRRIALKSDGWIPVGLAGTAMASQWKRVLDMAESAGRDPQKLRLVPVAHFALTEKPLDADRQVFQGSLDQVIEDVAEVAEAGAHELICSLDATTSSVDELLDKALTLLAGVTAARLR